MYKTLNSKFHERSSRFVSSEIGSKVLMTWSFFEASFWFIAPDFLLALFGILKPKEKSKFFIKALVASLFGGIAYYILNIISFNTMSMILSQTPFITERMIVFIRDTYVTHGIFGALFQSFSFMSFKIWTHIAVESNLNPYVYFFLVMISRSLRLYLVLLLASFIGSSFPDFVRKHFAIIFILYSFTFFSILVILK